MLRNTFPRIGLAVAILLFFLLSSTFLVAGESRTERCRECLDNVNRRKNFAINSEDLNYLLDFTKPERESDVPASSYSLKLFSDLIGRISQINNYVYKYDVEVDSKRKYMCFKPMDYVEKRVGPSRTILPDDFDKTIADLSWHLRMYCDWLEIKEHVNVEALRKMTSRYPKSPVFAYKLSDLYMKIGKDNLAKKYREKAIQLSSSRELLYQSLADFYFLEKKVTTFDELRPLAKSLSVSENPILVGVGISLSGRLARIAKFLREGYLWWEDDVNRRGGLLGRPAKILFRDDRSRIEEVEMAYRDLVSTDKVDLLLGPLGSENTIRSAKIAEKYGVPFLAAESFSPKNWEQGFKSVFMTLSPPAAYFNGPIEVGKEHGLRRVAILVEDRAFLRAAVMGTHIRAKQSGMDVVFSAKFPVGSKDFTPLLTKAKGEKPEVFIFASLYPLTGAIALKQMREINIIPKILFISSSSKPKFYEHVGPLADYVYGVSAWEPEPTIPYPGIKEFIASYKRRWDYMPNEISAKAAAAAVTLETAVKKAMSVDNQKVRKALSTLEVKNFFGEYTVDTKGYQVGHKTLMLQWQDGKKRVVWPKPLAVANPIYPMPVWNNR